MSADGFSWTALLGGTKWGHFPQQYREIVEQANSSSQYDAGDPAGDRRAQLYFAAFHAFQAGVQSLPVGNYSLSKRLLDVSGRPCATETYAWRVASWFGRRNYVIDPDAVLSRIEEASDSKVSKSPGKSSAVSGALLADSGGVHSTFDWSVEDVITWLGEEGLGRYSSTFQEHQVDGEMLLQLDEEMMLDDLRIQSKLDRRKLITKRKKLEEDTPAGRSILDASFARNPRALMGLVGEEVLRQLRDHEPLDELPIDLRKARFALEEARELVDMLELNTSVTSLRFTALDNNEAALLSTALQSTPQITQVHLVENCELTDPGIVQQIYDRTWCNLKALELRRLAANDPELTELSWAWQGLGEGVALRLARALRSNTILKTLNIVGNHFGEAGLATLLDVLSTKTHYTHVSILIEPGLTVNYGENIGSGISYDDLERYSHAEHGAFSLKRSVDASLIARVLELQQSIRDKAWQTKHSDIFTQLATGNPECSELIWARQGLGDAVATRLIKVLSGNTYVTRLDLSYNNFSESKIRDLANVVRARETLTELKLLPSPRIIDPDLENTVREVEQGVRDRAWCTLHASTLVKLAENDQRLTELYWHNSGIGDAVALELAQALHSNNHLIVLSLNGNAFGDAGARALLGVLKSNRAINNLTWLPAPGVVSSDLLDEMLELQRSIKQAEVLKLLVQNDVGLTRLGAEQFDAEAFEWLARGPLVFNSTVTEIDISHCSKAFNIHQSQSERALLELLAGNRTIDRVLTHSMNLSRATSDIIWSREHCVSFGEMIRQVVTDDPELVTFMTPRGIGDRGAKALARAIRYNSQLRSIMLAENTISHNGSRALLAALTSTGKTIEMSSNHNPPMAREIQALHDRAFCDEQASILKRLSCSDPDLRQLSLDERGFGDTAAIRLGEVLRTNCSLQRLTLSGNVFSEIGAEALFQAAAECSSLTELRLLPSPRVKDRHLINKIKGAEKRVSCRAVLARLVDGAGASESAELQWRGQHIDDTLMREIVRAIPILGARLVYLDLSENEFSDTTAEMLVNSLAALEGSLHRLKLLPNERIRNCHVITEAVRLEQAVVDREWCTSKAHSLELISANDAAVGTIDWADEQLGDISAAALAKAFRLGEGTASDGCVSIHGPVNSRVHSVKLSGNNFSDATLRMLTTLFRDAHSVRSVSLVPQALVTDPTVIKAATTLEQDVFDRVWCEDNARTFMRLGGNDESLSELGWSGMGIGDGVALALVDALAGNTALVKLNLTKNKITDAGAAALVEALRANTSMTNFQLLPNAGIKRESTKQKLSDVTKLFFPEIEWERPRKDAKQPPPRGDGNARPAPVPTSSCREWLDTWVPFDMSITGSVAWTELPDDAIRFEKVLPQQARRSRQPLSSYAMNQRRQQLSVRLSRCMPTQLHEFVRIVEENERAWRKVLET